MVALTIFGS